MNQKKEQNEHFVRIIETITEATIYIKSDIQFLKKAFLLFLLGSKMPQDLNPKKLSKNYVLK